LRPPVDTITAPLFPSGLPWLNVSPSQASIIQRDRPMLVEFWDFCRPNSLRTLPYVKAWHQRYGERRTPPAQGTAQAGLRIVGVHSPGFEPSRDQAAVREAVTRLGIEHEVLVDSELVVWREYENAGWPARYLFDHRARLVHYHYGEGAYVETELAIQRLLALERETVAPVHPEDIPGARLAPQTRDQEGPYSGAYEAGGVWVVLDGRGTLRYDDLAGHAGIVNVAHPGAYPLIEHERHTAGVLELDVGPGVRCMATCFTPGVS
jgi:hypothetical protein